jgi:hypothetical protein
VFQWDETDGWKYHDANVMPFPHGSYTSLQEAISGSSSHLDQAKFSDDCLPENGVGSVDDYWDAYDQASDEDRSDIFHVKEDNNQDDTEDSYWAQYASIQGYPLSASSSSTN